MRQVVKRCPRMCDRAGGCLCAYIVEWPMVPKANSAVISSLGQMEGKTQCHHGYFFKPWTHTYTHWVSAPVWGGSYHADETPCSFKSTNINKNISVAKNKMLPPRRASRQDDNDDLADKLEHGGAKTIQLPLEIHDKIPGVKNNGCGVEFVPGFQNEQGVCWQLQ